MLRSRAPRNLLLLCGAAMAMLGHSCEEHRPGIALEYASPDVDPECSVDDDCTLMPSQMTCCGECDPAPPFEAVPRTAVDARLLELETACARQTRLCEPPVCDRAPPGCTAYAICVDGRCRLIANGCEVRVAACVP